MTSEGQRPSAASKMALFDLEDDLKKTWATFTESSDEKCFRKFVRGLVSSWEKSNSWDDLMTSSLHGGCTIELGELPDELLPALSKFLIIAKDDADQGTYFLFVYIFTHVVESAVCLHCLVESDVCLHYV